MRLDQQFQGPIMSNSASRRFEGKVAAITGAGNGIGLAMARMFAAEGADVIIAEINEAAGKAAVATIEAEGGKAHFYKVDVSSEEQVAGMVEKVVADLGHIDILVNNAGVILHKSIIDCDLKDWERQMAVQLTGPFLTMKHVGKHMIARGQGGRIVNISSVAGSMGRIKGGPHCAAKAGVNLITKVAAMEFAEHGITVNAVAPGLVDVEIQRAEENISNQYKTTYIRSMPLGRLGLPEEIGMTVLFLASDQAPWTTGQVHFVDGGMMSGHYHLNGMHDRVLTEGH
jgi:3alpha(or 20beta)-hydroxysteroid dehydrogenase